MSEADDLARRFFALWADYLAGLAADPNMTEPLRRWLATVGSPPAASPAEADNGGRPRSPPDAAAAAGSPGSRDVALDELARRLDELAGRVAELEHRNERSRRTAVAPRRRNRSPRS